MRAHYKATRFFIFRYLMGLWFFLTVAIVCNMGFRAYKLRMLTRENKSSDDRVNALEHELKAIREKIQHLDEAVFFGDYELKKKFKALENDIAKDV